MSFQKATRQKVHLKVAITGPSGSGKTYSALRMAFGLGQKVAVIDTENGSASLYADLGDYDVMEITSPFTVDRYTKGIKEAVAAGYEVLIIDSLSHAWAGEGGLLEQKTARDARGGNSFSNWAEVTKIHEAFKSAILQSPIHIIATMRSKQDYVLENDERGKSTPRKVGLAPIQREGMEYEFTCVFDVDMSHRAITSKDRTGLFTDETAQITEDHGRRLQAWLQGASGELPAAPPTMEEAKAQFKAKCGLFGYSGPGRPMVMMLLGHVEQITTETLIEAVRQPDALWTAATLRLRQQTEREAENQDEPSEVAA